MVFYAQTITKEHSANNTKSKPQHNWRYIIEVEIIIVSIAVVFIYNACHNNFAEIVTILWTYRKYIRRNRLKFAMTTYYEKLLAESEERVALLAPM